MVMLPQGISHQDTLEVSDPFLSIILGGVPERGSLYARSDSWTCRFALDKQEGAITIVL